MKISMYLGPSKYWWAYLGIRSNPSLVSAAAGQFDRAIFFDDPALLPAALAGKGGHAIRYFYIFWDGLSDEQAMERARAVVGAGAVLTALVVGGFSAESAANYDVQSLYPEGALEFKTGPLRFDARTRAILLSARVKAFLMPVKNLLVSKGRRGQTIELLLGKSRIVFCGSYGTIPKVLEQLCDRHSVDFGLFDGYEYYGSEPVPSFPAYRRVLRSDGEFLANLYDRSEIDGRLFAAAVHLLGREYFVEKIRSLGLAMFVNGYAAGININVYTTPFYAQHVFLDFGSAVGTGNYPRLADLRYFKKQVVEIALGGDFEVLLTAARSGTLEEHFEREWKLKAPQISDYLTSTPMP